MILLVKKINLFVPGRLCIFGEHSDWAASYNLNNGYAIATTIEEGIYATCTPANKFIFINENKELTCDMSINKLTEAMNDNEYYTYVFSSAIEVLKKYKVSGIKISITKQTLPIKKGLSSSAAICILTIRAFNQMYDLGMSLKEEMDLAYTSERNAKSKCGRLDQIVALGNETILMEFSANDFKYDKLKIGKDIHIVFADLNGNKNTKKILNDLNNAYQNNNNPLSKGIINYLGKINKKINYEVKEALEKGNIKKIGQLMTESQRMFDKYMLPACKEELCAPKLHEVLSSIKVKEYTYGGKGVGSQGDGSVQFIAKDKSSQEKLKKYLLKKFNMKSYSLTIKENVTIKKAIIPLAGNGTRMYPFTKNIPKAFIPIYKDGMLKPVFLIILEEIIESGIDKIALVINPGQKKIFKDFFTKDSNKYLKNIYQKITFIIQKQQLGLSHAICSCNEFVNNEPVLLVLGDQFFKSNSKINCTKQILLEYQKYQKTIISVCKVSLDDVEKYGIFYGNIFIKNNEFIINKIVEKPEKNYALNNLYINGYYAAFGEYIILPKLFNKMYELTNNSISSGEYPFTEIIDEYIKENESIALIPSGKMYDVGNPKSYLKAMNAFKNNRRENKK